MKKVIYYCDICNKEIIKPKEELSCCLVQIDVLENWEKPVAVQHKKNICTCRECGNKILDFIERMNSNNGV